MTSLTAQAADLIRRTETELRGLLAEAVALGDYVAVLQLAQWARRVSQLLQVDEKPVPSPTLAYRLGSTGPAETAKVPETSPPWTAWPTKPKPSDYPLFFRRDDKIFRLSWSRREQNEYEHRAPVDVLIRLGAAIAEAGKNGRIFTTDDLLPQLLPDGSEVPRYQAYVVLALLKRAGFLDQHGRQGYSIRHPQDFATGVDALWKQLPTR